MILSNNSKRASFLIAFVIVVSLVGIGSHFFLGNDNPIEQKAEKMIDDIVEIQLELPPNTIHLDLTPAG